MPTLTAPAAAHVAAQRLGLAPPPSSKPPASPAEPKLQTQPATPAPAGNEDPAVAAPSTPTSTKGEKQRAHHAASQAARERLLPLLSARFPEVFKLPPVPLAIGIHKQIIEAAGEDIDPRELGAFAVLGSACVLSAGRLARRASTQSRWIGRRAPNDRAAQRCRTPALGQEHEADRQRGGRLKIMPAAAGGNYRPNRNLSGQAGGVAGIAAPLRNPRPRPIEASARKALATCSGDAPGAGAVVTAGAVKSPAEGGGGGGADKGGISATGA